MTFFAILFALLLEQARPLARDNGIHHALVAWTRAARRHLDAGQAVHGALTWGVAVAVPALAVALVYALLQPFSDLLSLAWSVLVLYFTLGFRQFSHHFTCIRQALQQGDERTARQALAEWQEVDVSALPRQELLRHVIEFSALAAHRHVFGVLVAYVVFALLGAGPAGAVLYRLAEMVARHWANPVGGPSSGAAATVAQQAWAWVDHVPVRATGVAFAIVGNFEEAIAAWRQDAPRYSSPNDGIVLAATSGAINVRLGGAALRTGQPSAYATEDPRTWNEAREPQPAHLHSLVGLVWRGVVLWMLVLALTGLARSMG